MSRHRHCALLGLLTLGTALAQTTWDRDGYRTALLDCVRRTAAEVACTFTSTHTGEPEKITGFFSPDGILVVNPDGRIIKATSVAVAGGSPTSALQNVTMYKGLPVKVIVTFPYADAGGVLPRLEYFKQVLSNVSVRGGPGSAPAPATVTAGTFDVSLSGCTPMTGGAYTCTGAVVTPRR